MAQKLTMVPHVLALLAPVDGTTSAKISDYVNMGLNDWVTFLLYFGSADATTMDIQLWQSSAASCTSKTALGFNYRYQTTATDSMSTITAVTASSATASFETTGTAVASKLYLIDVDPDTMTDGKKYLKLSATGSSGNNLVAIAALVFPKYPQAIPVASS